MHACITNVMWSYFFFLDRLWVEAYLSLTTRRRFPRALTPFWGLMQSCTVRQQMTFSTAQNHSVMIKIAKLSSHVFWDLIEAHLATVRFASSAGQEERERWKRERKVPGTLTECWPSRWSVFKCDYDSCLVDGGGVSRVILPVGKCMASTLRCCGFSKNFAQTANLIMTECD